MGKLKILWSSVVGSLKSNPIKPYEYELANTLIEKEIIAKELHYQDLISSHLRDEELLIASEIRYRRLFESAKDGILILDAESGMIIDVNPFLIEMLGFSKEQFIKKAIWEIGIFHDIIANHEKFLELQQLEYIRYEDMPLRTIDGHMVNVEFISNVYIADGRRVIQCNIRDITQRKLADAALVLAKEKAEESDRLKTAFLHNISHEIRTPMNAIVGFAGFLNEPELSAEDRKHFVDIIVQSSDQLLSIISDIVSMSSIEAGQAKIIESEFELNGAMALLQEQFIIKGGNTTLFCDLKSSLPEHEVWIITDETKFLQVFTNLIGNALKFTEQGFVTYGYEIKNNKLQFYVEDTGIGISKEMHKEIFKRFRQIETTNVRQFGGSGLGLAISKAYVELLGGKMWVKSVLGKGSTFYFTIPFVHVRKNNLSENRSDDPLNDVINLPKTILVAEDEDSNFKFLEVLLSNKNIKIIRAVNGLEATKIVTANDEIDLVLMDIKMPEMNGYEATKQINSLKPHLPIIAQTAYSNEVDKQKALACGCADYISKPINADLLLSKISAQLNRAYN